MIEEIVKYNKFNMLEKYKKVTKKVTKGYKTVFNFVTF